MLTRIAILFLLMTPALFPQSVPVIFDTDMGNDVDDALALAMLHALESRAECRLIAVTITKDNAWSAVYVDLVNTFYGRAHIPIGIVMGSRITPEESPMIRVPAERRTPAGLPVYPRRLVNGAEAPEAVNLLRRVLTGEKDNSVVMVQVGFSTNLAHLMNSPVDIALVKQKVKLLSVMAGNFAQPKPEFNVQRDIASAKKLFEKWPTPIVFSGWEVGEQLKFPAARIERDFAWAPDHPVVDAYRNYMKMPYDRQTWDLTSVLYAVRPDGGYFSLSPPGAVTVEDAGVTTFHADASGRHRYLVLDAGQKARTLETMVTLASQPRR